MKAHRDPSRDALRRLVGFVFAGLLLGGSLLGCRSARIAPYAFKPTQADPRILVRVPVGTPGSTTVPLRERLHKKYWATDCGQTETPDPRWACCPEGAERAEWRRNEVAMMLGYTGVRAGDGVTLGVGYERRLSGLLGVGVFGEYVFGESQIPVVGACLLIHPTRDLRFTLGAGAEFDDGNAEALARFGLGYTLYNHDEFKVSPTAYLDLVHGREPVFVFGLELGKEF